MFDCLYSPMFLGTALDFFQPINIGLKRFSQCLKDGGQHGIGFRDFSTEIAWTFWERYLRKSKINKCESDVLACSAKNRE